MTKVHTSKERKKLLSIYKVGQKVKSRLSGSSVEELWYCGTIKKICCVLPIDEEEMHEKSIRIDIKRDDGVAGGGEGGTWWIAVELETMQYFKIIFDPNSEWETKENLCLED